MIALQTLLSIAFFMGLVYLWNDYRVDRLRQDLFSVRDALFDEARAGHISFESAGYQATRDMCNGLIRFGHRISILEAALFRFLTPTKTAAAARTEFEAIFTSLPDDERAVVNRYLERANRCVVAHTVRSPIFMCMVLPPILALACARWGTDLVGKATMRLAKALQSLDALAMIEGRKAAAPRPGRSSVFAG